jgi:hypothetical protein
MKKNLPAPGKAAAVVGVMLIVLLIGFFVVIRPKRSEAAKLTEQINATRDQITALQTTNNQPVGPAIHVADLFKLSRAMPDRADLPSILLQLSEIAAETGVTFQAITPSDPVQLGAYQQIGIALTFEGHFYDLADFLYRLRNLVGVHQGVLTATGRLFTVDSIQLNEGELLFPEVKATLTVSAYVFGDGTLTIEPTTPPTTGSTTPGAAATPAPGATTPVTPGAPATPTTPAAPAAPATEGGSQPIPAAPPGATAAGA